MSKRSKEEQKSFNEILKIHQHTKNTFQNCERLLKTATFSGAECLQVSDCINLMQYMVKETGTTIQKRIAEFKQGSDESISEATPVPAYVPPTPTDLKPHLPEEAEEVKEGE